MSQGAYGDIDRVRAAISRGATATNEEDKSTYVDRQTNYASRGNHEFAAIVIYTVLLFETELERKSK